MTTHHANQIFEDQSINFAKKVIYQHAALSKSWPTNFIMEFDMRQLRVNGKKASVPVNV